MSDEYVVTILIHTHGKVIDMNVTERQLEKMNENVQYASMSCGVKDYHIRRVYDMQLYYLARDKYAVPLKHGERHIDRMKNVIPIPFDKSLSVSESDGNQSLLERFDELRHGIFVVAIHTPSGRLVYPSQESGDLGLNILFKDHIEFIYSLFGDKNRINELRRLLEDESIPFPSQRNYISEELKLRGSTDAEDMEKGYVTNEIADVRNKYMTSLKKWNISKHTKKSNYFASIRLSTLIHLLKIIFANCRFNIIDVSCSSKTLYLPEEEKKRADDIEKLYEPIEIDDLELLEEGRMGEKYKQFGGKRSSKQKRINTRTTRQQQNGQKRTKIYRHNKTIKYNL